MVRKAALQQGLIGALLAIVLVIAMIAIIAGHNYYRGDAQLGQQGTTSRSLQRLSDALVAFASLNKRLPCPAAGNSTTGAEAWSGTTANCTSAGGVVPWAALSLREEDILDGWGRRISYRVYSGTTGFTQANGVSMTDCNTNAGASGTADANGMCRPSPSRSTTTAAFFAGKGISATNEVPTTTTGFAFVLMSHGENGSGAYLAGAAGRMSVPPSGGREYSNSQSSSPFGIGSPSIAGVDPASSSYFDDVVITMAATDLVSNVKLTARDWGLLEGTTTSAQTLARSDIAAALGFTPGFNTGQGSVDFGQFTATAQGSSARNISSGIGVSGQGLGSIGTGSFTSTAATINSATSESVFFAFPNANARYLGITLVDFGIDGSGTERVRFRFYNAGSLLVTVNKSACSAASSGDVLANYVIDPGVAYDQLEVVARTTSFGADSQFLVGGFRTCDTSLGSNICTAPNAVAGNNCP